MPRVPYEEFTRMNIMAGTARSLERAALTEEDRALWDRDFDLLCNDLSNLVDEKLGADLRKEKDWYTSACEVAKGSFNGRPFGGLKAATGQFGFRMIGPQDLKQASTDATNPAGYSWARTVTTESDQTQVQYAIGYGTAVAYTCNEANHAEVLAFHRLISYKPSPRLIAVEFEVNDYPYVPYTVEPFSKISKDDKLFKIIPMPGRILLHPGGKLRVDMFFDLLTGQTAPSGTTDLDIEIALFGLVFGEYDYLEAAELT